MGLEVSALNNKIQEIMDLREEEAVASNVKKVITNRLEVAEREMIDMLASEGLSSHRGPAGLVTLSRRTSVRIPRSDEEREAFFGFLKDRGLYDTMVTVNSTTLNSFYKSELEAAEARGEMEILIPGINNVTTEPTLSVRKK